MNSLKKHPVIGIRDLSPSTYILRIERLGLQFKAGQYIHVGPLPGIACREYSIYSSPNNDYLEILIKVIPEGTVSPQLHHLKEGDMVAVEGPFGFFCIEDASIDDTFLFIATGTGISPFHSITQYYPALNYRLVHGVRHGSELYEHADYDCNRIIRCITGDSSGDLQGRVTEWLRHNPVPHNTWAYLCGNCDMIYEAYDILGEQGIVSDRIHAEVYF